MKKYDIIKNFFNPKSIAVIGASKNPLKIGNILMRKLDEFEGNIIPINPEYEKIGKRKVYKKIEEYKENIDLAIIAIPAKFVPRILKGCGKKGIKNIIIISAGFSEKRKYKLNRKLLKIKQKYNLNILGPNCFGIFNPKSNLDSTFANTTPKKGGTAFISQSGALWSYISDLDIGFSGYVSLGNMLDLDFADFIEYFNKDKKTKKIICYIEKLKEGKRFIEACKNSNKKIIVIKTGRTEKGQKAAISHTGSLATDYEIYKGAFNQARVKQEKFLSSAIGLKTQSIIKSLSKKNVIIITNAGGASALLTDELTDKKIKVDKVIDILGTANPIDYRKALNKFINYNGEIITIMTPQSMSHPNEVAYLLSTHPAKDKIKAIFLGQKSIEEAIKIMKRNKMKVFTRVI
jgi:acetate---CoA ligase (ADP-forming) subunit alpha